MMPRVQRSHWDPPPSPLSPSRKCGHIQGDRFIPSRSAMDFEVAHFSIFREANENNSSILNVTSPVKEEYKRKLAENLLHDAGSPDSAKILAFKKKPGLAIEGSDHRMQTPFAEDFTEISSYSRKHFRHIPQSPERILDAPELVDDYYLNLLDWSSKNVVAVALGSTVYLWDADTSAITQLMQTNEDDDYITSVSWAGDGKYIAVGLNCSEIQIWDAYKRSQVRKMAGHSARVGSLAWNGSVISSGGRDTRIINHDVRIRDHITSTLRGHNQEVCGLKWSPSGQHLASGGNDNLLHVWEMGSQRHLYRWDEHQAAVKALSWCPFQANLLASGGGTADRCIKLWNTQTGICLTSLDTLSQVCSLLWSKNQKEILSSHGYSQNQLCLWRYPSMVKIAELTGHNARVLHLAQSPDGSTVVSAAADETLRFWKIFGSSSTVATTTSANASSNTSAKVGEYGVLSMRGIR